MLGSSADAGNILLLTKEHLWLCFDSQVCGSGKVQGFQEAISAIILLYLFSEKEENTRGQ